MGDPNPPFTLREALRICLEAIPGRDLEEFAASTGNGHTIRRHVLDWMHAYARNRGVILDDRDILTELDERRRK